MSPYFLMLVYMLGLVWVGIVSYELSGTVEDDDKPPEP
jgi:hypothetical protein